MQKQSYGSVKVTWLNPKLVISLIQKAVRRLAAKHPEIEKVIMFGSMAKGEAIPGSDVDLLFVLSSDKRLFIERIPDYMISNKYAGVDVFPYTKDELERMLTGGNNFISEVLREGITIYERG